MNVNKKINIVTKLVLMMSLLSAVAFSQVAQANDDALYCLHSQSSFEGRKVCGSYQEVNWVGWRWYGDISSVKVKEGYELVAFDYVWQFGQSTVLSGDNANLGGWNDRIASFHIRKKRAEQEKVCFYSRRIYRGKRFCTNGNLRWLGWYWNNRISSVSIPAGKEVKLYNRWSYTGRSVTLTQSTSNLGPLGFNNRTSSFEIGSIGAGQDADNDGVSDASDNCPETPLGETVNENGCALTQLDGDNDGVSDADDQCPATPEGEAPNGEGCAPSQLDSDNDGVSDAVDQCPATPAGEVPNSEGCAPSQLDADNDGVNDAVDQCPATPQGEKPNAQGCSPTQLDTDNDGVNDALDQCPATPEREQANAEGCALSQLDTDNDGVNDAVDQCPATPQGETPNAQGCSPTQLDADNDGVSDAVDQCPATSANEQANQKGCALSQLDTDNDGANDMVDQCPNTPEGEAANTEGCALSQLDTDNDGVNDAADQCPDTPEGEIPNAEGCALTQIDSDNDGANDAVDQCPNTPEGETANAEGCAPSQLDTDNDGVNDAADQCSDTPVDETPNAEGCALTQLDSDNDGVNDAADQCPATPEGETPNAEGCALSQLDTDSDGVNDAVDQCPNTPEGEAPNAEGCALTQLDSDNDGVNDAVDQCPSTPEDDTPNSEGCSPDQIDSDNDGTPDYLDAFPNDPNETSDLDGDGIGDNADSDRDGDGVANEADAFPNDPAESVDQDGDGIGDNADPDRDGDGVPNVDDYFPDDPESSSVPTVQITSPSTLITVGSSPIRITGTVDDLSATLIINGVEIPQNNGSFEADVALEEGANNIIVRAIDEKNHEGTATISVSLDKTPPYITVQSPEKSGKVFAETISVSGLVNDIVRGTVSEDEALVRVTGPVNTVTASVSNRSYLAENVQLQMGDNQITIIARDAVGNENTDTFTVTYEPQRDKKIELVSGNAQTAKIQKTLAQPLSVKLTENDLPVADKTVVFRVTEGDGQLQPGTDAEGNGAVVTTDANGVATVSYKLGSRAGTGNHKVTARAVGYKGEVEFYHSAVFGDGIQMGIIAGNNQRGSVRQPLPQPLVLAVTDAGANLIPNADILFEVTRGSGTFANGLKTYETQTDTDGRASAPFVLGPEEGLDVQRVTARLVGTESTAGFTTSAFMPGDPAQTKISGVVLDNQDRPLENVTIRVEGSTRQAITNAEGQFSITEAPVGPVHLFVEGSTTTSPGEWPSLSYNIVTVPGVDNPMASPIYLVELDTENAVFVGRDDVVVIHPDLPGFELEVAAGSVTFPDGAKEGMLSITRVNANKIPMPPPNGMQPQLIVTIQPHGAKFDPPARLTLPNTDGHAPNAEVEMYSYDHDLEEFVTIGLGTVSKDGAIVKSNVGNGVIKAGWHCGSPPGGSGCCENEGGGAGECPECQRSKSGSCGDGNCEPIEDKQMSECKECSSGQLIKKTAPIEGEDCKACENGEVKNFDDGTACNDKLYCTSATGVSPGLDKCSGGKCEGEPIKQVVGDSVVIDFDPTAKLASLIGVANKIGKVEISASGSIRSTEVEKCCENIDAIKSIIRKEGRGTVKGKIKGDIPLPIALIKLEIEGELAGDYRSFEQLGEECENDFECSDDESVRGRFTVGAKVKNRGNSDVVEVSGGGRGGASYVRSFGCDRSETDLCILPFVATGKVKFFNFISEEFVFVISQGTCDSD